MSLDDRGPMVLFARTVGRSRRRGPAMDPRRALRTLEFPLRAPTVPGGVEPAPQPDRVGAGYDTGWARQFPARLARTVMLEAAMRPAVAAVAQPERRGLDRLVDATAAGEPVIFAANHHSHLDTPLVLTSLPEPWRYRVFVGAAADYFFRNRGLSAISALALNAIPIERARVTRRSADLAAELIEDGWSMLIFPEGGRSPDGWGQEFRGGAAYLARRCDVAVVPVHQEGTGQVWRKDARKLNPGPTTVTFGSPLRVGDGEDTRHFATRVEAGVAALADEVAYGFYESRKRAHAQASSDLTGPQAPTWRRAWSLPHKPTRRRDTSSRNWPW